MNKRKNPAVYLAGPLFTWGEEMFNLRWKKHLECAAQGEDLAVDFVLPQEMEGKLSSLEGVFEANREKIDESKAVVAILDGSDCDSGTAWEIGYAFAANKHVIGVRTDFRKAGETGLGNLMITESIRLSGGEIIDYSTDADGSPLFYSGDTGESMMDDMAIKVCKKLKDLFSAEGDGSKDSD